MTPSRFAVWLLNHFDSVYDLVYQAWRDGRDQGIREMRRELGGEPRPKFLDWLKR